MEIENDKKEYFKKLFLENREKNLLERIAYLTIRDADYFNRKLGFANTVYKHYWAMVAIPGKPFAYSVGMDYCHGLPDVMILSDKLSQTEFKVLINEINAQARDSGELELGRDYFDQVVMQKGLAIETDPRDDGKPPSERRIIAGRDGEEFKLVNVEQPLVFQKYNIETELEFPCGYLRDFNYYFMDKHEVNLIYTDLR